MAQQQLGLQQLAEHLETLQTVGELDRHLEADGGILMSEERFSVYCSEYARRGVSMPQ